MQTRFDLENGWKLCQGCHTTYTFNDEAWIAWMKSKIGEDGYARLVLRSQVRGKVDLAMTIVALKAEAQARGLVPAEFSAKGGL